MGCIYGARFTISCFTACVTFADLVSCKNWYISSLLVLDNRQEELPGLRRRIVHINPPCRTELKWVFLSLEEKANGMFWYCKRKLFSENTDILSCSWFQTHCSTECLDKTTMVVWNGIKENKVIVSLLSWLLGRLPHRVFLRSDTLCWLTCQMAQLLLYLQKLSGRFSGTELNAAAIWVLGLLLEATSPVWVWRQIAQPTTSQLKCFIYGLSQCLNLQKCFEMLRSLFLKPLGLNISHEMVEMANYRKDVVLDEECPKKGRPLPYHVTVPNLTE